MSSKIFTSFAILMIRQVDSNGGNHQINWSVMHCYEDRPLAIQVTPLYLSLRLVLFANLLLYHALHETILICMFLAA